MNRIVCILAYGAYILIRSIQLPFGDMKRTRLAVTLKLQRKATRIMFGLNIVSHAEQILL